MNMTTRSGSGTATGFSSTAFTTEKIAVLAPMPSVSAATAARVNAGLCANMRSECFKSFTNASMGWLDGENVEIVEGRPLRLSGHVCVCNGPGRRPRDLDRLYDGPCRLRRHHAV